MNLLAPANIEFGDASPSFVSKYDSKGLVPGRVSSNSKRNLKLFVSCSELFQQSWFNPKSREFSEEKLIRSKQMPASAPLEPLSKGFRTRVQQSEEHFTRPTQDFVTGRMRVNQMTKVV